MEGSDALGAPLERMLLEYYGPGHQQSDGPGTRADFVRRRTLPRLEELIGPLAGRRVVDYGCGTGSSALPMVEMGAEVVGFDIDLAAIRIARQRLEDAVGGERSTYEFRAGTSARAAGLSRGGADLVYLNAVIERVPKRDRPAVLADVVRLVRPGGHVVIAQSPNRFWPRDVYLSGLWLVPWTPAGSAVGRWAAVRWGRQRDRRTVTVNKGLDLEQRGLWGVTYPELLGALPGGSTCVNPRQPSSERPDGGRPSRRRWAERLAAATVCRWFDWPLDVIGPMFAVLVFQLPDATDA